LFLNQADIQTIPPASAITTDSEVTALPGQVGFALSRLIDYTNRRTIGTTEQQQDQAIEY
jgi:hypothetical protein